MGTSIERHSAQTDLSKKAEGYGVPGQRIDGMDVLAVREGVAEHIRIAREERRPTLVEAFTYRFRGHSAADPEVYREKDEVEEWRAKDPIEAFAKRCIDEDVISEDDMEKIRERAEKDVLDAVKFADESARAAARDDVREPLRPRRHDGLVRRRRAHPRAPPRRARGGGLRRRQGAGRGRRRPRRAPGVEEAGPRRGGRRAGGRGRGRGVRRSRGGGRRAGGGRGRPGRMRGDDAETTASDDADPDDSEPKDDS